MKKLKFTKRGKIITGIACATTLATSSAVIANIKSQNKNTSLSEELNENQQANIFDSHLTEQKANNFLSDVKNSDNNSSAEIQMKEQTEKMEPQDKIKKMFNFSDWNKKCLPSLIVINKNNPIPDNYELSLVSYNGKQIHSLMKSDLENMINAASRDGIQIFIYSGYRTIAEQTKYFNSQTAMYKKQGYSEQAAQEKASQSVARPKTSEHNTGLAIDFNCVRDDFYKTKEYTWLIKNAHKYGFILRYAKNKIDKTGVIYEPWHFRYVGKEHSTKIIESGLCLEEYVERLIAK